MSVNVVPHLNFRGEARMALEFYQSVFGGALTMVTYEDLGNVQEPGDDRLVMWGQGWVQERLKPYSRQNMS